MKILYLEKKNTNVFIFAELPSKYSFLVDIHFKTFWILLVKVFTRSALILEFLKMPSLKLSL